ncbi:hypothetical protein WJX81_001740 [Elliptochloris bilobata]|uniref:Glutaredoxin domain-containing protein n=1 Tax=Elliptochloris bilobata TaxID=381761 RepID=A0AAW1RGF2_9CHLO
MPVPCVAVLALLAGPLLAAGAPATFAEQAYASSARTCVAQAGSLADVVKEQNAKNKVVVYSKSYCPYCAQVKGLFNKLNVDYKLFELDQIADGQDVQNALHDVTSRRTVPQVFVDGKFIGGCDDTTGMYQSGELKTLLETAGVSAVF